MKSKQKLKFIIVGLGNRGRDSFARALLGFPNRGLPEFTERAEITAFVDINIERARVANEVLATDIPIFSTVEEALKKVQADWAVVTTADHTHADVCESLLNHKVNVVVDKPLATSVWECNRIIDTAKRNNRQVIVGHNSRYNEYALATAKLVRSGAIGRVLHVEAAEVLDFDHGGSYFNRWHSEFAKSAGLMNHKCCHQLDLINWILDDEPIGVNAIGARDYYVPRADLPPHGPRCTVCALGKNCKHYVNIDRDYPSGRPEDRQRLRRMYIDVEKGDNFIRDACVFSDRNTINDHEALNIRYAKGTLVSFNLVCFAPREYFYYYFTGDKGRLEFGVSFKPKAAEKNAPQGMAEMGMMDLGGQFIRLLKEDGTVQEINVERKHANFGHGGSDVKLVSALLNMPIENVDPIQHATPEQARNAVAIADMAARSIASGGRYVSIKETGRDFPPAPPVQRD
ncbi:MAG: Gfo/Idh/MocA family protein [Kiritimatiellia bacterium]